MHDAWVSLVCPDPPEEPLSSPPSSSPPKRPSWTDDERARSDDDAGGLKVMLTEGTLLARKYRLQRPAGFGGMAQLWVATNESTGVEVCIKVLVPGAGQDDAVKRFRREANAAARLNHRAIVRVFDLLELTETGDAVRDEPPVAFAIVMELLEGETLGDALLKRGKLPLEETLDIAVPFLSALAIAHRAGIVHRDVKPDNVFLAKDVEGQVSPKVLDFGVSKMPSAGCDDSKPLTLDGAMIGTPSFMSPEQVKGKLDLDARSDVFSAGIVIVMMLSGKNPFDSNKIHSVLSAIMEQEPPRPPGVPDTIWAVLSRMLEKDPAQRYNDATEAGIALRRAAGRASITDSGTNPIPKGYIVDMVTTVQPVVESPSAAPPKHASKRPKSRSSAATVALILAAVAAAVVLASILKSTDPRAPETAKPPEAPVPMPSAKAPHADAGPAPTASTR